MAAHSSATAHGETPHLTEITRTRVISNALRRRAQSVIDDRSIHADSRALIRYCLEINDPCLAELVRRADVGENLIEALDRSEISESNDDVSMEQKISALTEIICRAGNEHQTASAALFVLMGTIEDSRNPKLLANSAKHLAFNHCGELNLNGMVDAQLALLEAELLADQ